MKTYEEKVNDLFCGRLKGWALMDMETGKIVYEHIINESDMKDNLLPFDLEEAKKDPSRITDIYGKTMYDYYFFKNGWVGILWEEKLEADSDICYVPSEQKELLRLTPKRMFVKHNQIENSFSEISRDEAIGMQKWGATVYELIPVEQNK